MNISGIRPSEGFYSYNSIRVNELRNSQIMSSKQAALNEQINRETENFIL